MRLPSQFTGISNRASMYQPEAQLLRQKLAQRLRDKAELAAKEAARAGATV